MKYALRKLIAFVFLGGLFWFIYQDLDNLDKPWFLHALGLLVVVFAFFWLLVPMVVVGLRIRKRRRGNLRRYDTWRAGMAGRPQPLEPAKVRMPLAAGELAYWHEKGTLYARGLAEAESWTSSGEPSDVAFPHFGKSRHLQRTHVYITDRRVLFAGKGFQLAIAHAEIASVALAPGGLVFTVARGGARSLLAFTFQNPLAVRDVFAFAAAAGAGGDVV